MLVVATLMGFATVASAQYTDDSSVQYKEAVEVMSEINVINGYTDGSFRPTANVKRAEMAKMVAYIVAGGEDVGNLYASANTFTDCTNHWAKGYIAYASLTGFVAGVGDNKFNPEGSVTGTQAAKMLLCALGYDAAIEGYTGTSWAVNTLADAKEAGLLKGLEKVNMGAALSREAAAQMMFNALNAKTVKYSNKGSNIDLGNGVIINTGASTPEFINTATDGSTDWELLRDKYFEDLTLVETAGTADSLGRPAHKWTYKVSGKTETIGTYADTASLVFTTAVSADDMTETLDGYTYTADLKAVYNSASAQDTTTKAASSAAAIAALTGNGYTVEVFADDNNKITAVVVIAPSFGEVAVKEVAETKSHGAYTQYTITGVPSGRIYSTTVDEDEKDSAVVTGEVANKDKVLYYRDKDNTLYIEAVSVISGALTAKSSDNKLTIDGTQYAISAASTAPGWSFKTSSQDFYMDADGNIIDAVVASTDGNFVYVLEAKDVYVQNSDGTLDPTHKATVVTSDGVVESVITSADWESYAGSIVSYTINNKDQYVYAAPAADTTAEITAIGDDQSVFGGKIANNNTKYVVADYVDDDDDASTAKVLAGTVTTYTGFKNVPDYSGTVLEKTWGLDSDKDGILDVVFVGDNVNAVESGKYVYVKGTYSQTSAGYVFDTIVAGEDSTSTQTASDALTADTLYADLGAKTPAEVTGTKVENKGGVLYIDGSVYKKDGTNASTVADDVAVYIIDLSDDTCVSNTAADLTSEFDTRPVVMDDYGTRGVYVEFDGNDAATIYILYNSAD